MSSQSASRQTVLVVTMGCSKNLVDSERLLRKFSDAGWDARFDTSAPLPQGSTVVINTCGFIGDAKEESINEILRWGQARRDGSISCLIVMGCLAERYRNELPAELPEVDRWYGKTDWTAMIADLNPERNTFDRTLTTPSHHAYLKIAEGCNRFCAFCAIPLITGRFKSRTIDSLVQEAESLAARGVKELNIIAQDLSAYGRDLTPDGSSLLASLMRRLAEIPGLRRIRLHYAYPADFPMDVLDVMAENPKVCNYLDIALQHIADPVLQRMRRHIDARQTRELLAEIRRRVPGIHIRTTLMVGFPGETDDDFNQLLDFVREQRFERMGAFAYCEEDDTFAAKNFPDDVPQQVKQQRLDTLMARQEEIALEQQQQKVGSVQEVVIDRYEAPYYVGRTEYDSPEVDPEVLVKSTRPLEPGQYCNVRITEAMPFELIGEEAEAI